jgi:hypothetical protein
LEEPEQQAEELPETNNLVDGHEESLEKHSEHNEETQNNVGDDLLGSIDPNIPFGYEDTNEPLPEEKKNADFKAEVSNPVKEQEERGQSIMNNEESNDELVLPELDDSPVKREMRPESELPKPAELTSPRPEYASPVKHEETDVADEVVDDLIG